MRLSYLLLLSLAACSDSARFAPPDWSPAAYVKVATPLDVYDHAYRGRVDEKVVSLRRAREICAGHDACNYVRNGVCHIVLPRSEEAPVRDLAAYRRWEVAGCNGNPDERIVAHP